jgi:hypothetical protein
MLIDMVCHIETCLQRSMCRFMTADAKSTAKMGEFDE